MSACWFVWVYDRPRTLSLFPDVLTVVTLSPGFIFVAENVVRNVCTNFLILFETSVPTSWYCSKRLYQLLHIVRNVCTNFLILLRSGAVPCLPGLKFRLNIRCVAVTELWCHKNVSTANARCTADHWSMFIITLRTGSFKLFKRPFPGFLIILTL